MNLIRRNYDIVASIGTAGVLLAVRAPWPLWIVWGGAVAYQLGNRIIHGWAR